MISQPIARQAGKTQCLGDVPSRPGDCVQARPALGAASWAFINGLSARASLHTALQRIKRHALTPARMYASVAYGWAEQCHSVPSPTRQGNRIWKKVACSRLLRAGDFERTYQPFALRFRSVPDPIPWPRMDPHVCRQPMQRMRLENFHMRYPCPTRGEGTVGHGPSHLTQCACGREYPTMCDGRCLKS